MVSTSLVCRTLSSMPKSSWNGLRQENPFQLFATKEKTY